MRVIASQIIERAGIASRDNAAIGLSMLDAPSWGVMTGAALMGVAGLRVAWEAGETARRRRVGDQRTAERSRVFAADLEAALRYARASQPALKAWTGTRTFRVAAVVDEALDCKSYYLVPEDGRALARFEPGQYLTFHLPVSGGGPIGKSAASAIDRQSVVRCYSLSERPREDLYRVTVKRTPRGVASNYFHRQVGPATRLEVEAPQGAFFLEPTDDMPTVLCGAGVGVTPLVSMASHLVHRGDRRPLYFFAGFRNSGDHLFRTRMRELASDAANLRLDVCYSQPQASDRWASPGNDNHGDYHHVGRVAVQRLRQVLPSNNYRFYLCGPSAMMESLAPELLSWGVPAEHIRYEAFGPATVRGLSGAGGSAPCQVQFARSGKSLAWSGSETSLLDFAQQGGVMLPAGCRAGSCGQCRVVLSAGKVRHSKPPGVALAGGECLACIARPDGDVIVEA